MNEAEIKDAAASYVYYMISHERNTTLEQAFIAGAEANAPKWTTISEREPKTGEYLVLVTEDNDCHCGTIEIKGHSIWLGPQGLSKDYIIRYMVIPSPPNTQP